MAALPFQVFGVNILVRMISEAPVGMAVHCPKGSPVKYGIVMTRGDGFDGGANDFREMPPIGATVAFEENPEEVEGHYFYLDGQEYRVLHLDSVILAYPQE